MSHASDVAARPSLRCSQRRSPLEIGVAVALTAACRWLTPPAQGTFFPSIDLATQCLSVHLPTLPALDLVGPDGTRITIGSLDRTDVVGTLADRLGVESLWTDSRRLERDECLAEVDELRIGARLWRSPPPTVCDEGTPVEDAAVEVAVVTGPACSPWRPLPSGRHVVGRSPNAPICIDDCTLGAHHGLVTVDGASAQIVQLTGSVPIRVDGGEPEPDGVLDRAISLGASTVVVRSVAERMPASSDVTSGALAPHPTDPWRRLVWRSPHHDDEPTAEHVEAPVAPDEPRRPSATGLIGVFATAVGAVAVALVMRTAMFLVFAAMGMFAALVSHLVGVVVARRRRRQIREAHTAAVSGFVAAVDAMHHKRVVEHRRRHLGVAAAVESAFGVGPNLWHRRCVDELTAVVGRGTARWNPPVGLPPAPDVDASMLQLVERCSRLRRESAPITLRRNDAVALTGVGAHALAVARSLIVQLATFVGPADWQLVVVTADPERWRWADWLPHGALGGGAVVHVDDAGQLREQLDSVDADRLTLVVTDDPQLFTTRTGPLRRFVTASEAVSIVVVDADDVVPAMCTRVLTLGTTGSASWSGDVPADDAADAIEFVGVSRSCADRVARRLACLVDPEDDRNERTTVPTAVSLGELEAGTWLSSAEIARRWREGGHDPEPVAPLGLSGDGRVDIDLVRDGPHGLIAGTTGAGKSELLRTLVVSLAASVGPQHLNFVLVDYKGGSTFDACVALPHTVGLVTDLDDGLAERALVSLDAELHRRERLLRTVGAADLTEYRRCQVSNPALVPIARLVVVIDEFAALAAELPDFLAALVSIAQRGRSLGVHLLLATQRPAGVVNDDIRANTNLRLALRLHDRADATDVVGDALPAGFPRAVPGRSALRLGPDELVVFQAARCTGPVRQLGGAMTVERASGSVGAGSPSAGEQQPDGRFDEPPPSELEAAVAAIVLAAEADHLDAPHRPWVDPLEFPLTLDEVGAVDSGSAVAIGVVDDPGQQCRRPLTWHPDDGGLALVGAIGSGTTSTLIALAAAMCRQQPPGALHLHVIDARGDDGIAALASIAHCAGVVRLHEDERLHRLLARVIAAIDRRSSGEGDRRDIVVMIDGFASLRTALGAVERAATFDLLMRLVNDGPAAGIVLVLSDDAGSAMSMVAVAQRWIFHLDNPSAARGLGLRSAPVAGGAPGRFRILDSGLEAQVVHGAPGLAELATHDDALGGPDPIIVLSERVEVEEVAHLTSMAGANGVELTIGIDGVELAPTQLHLPIGDHVLILGSPRTGVSTALERCVLEWRSAMEAAGSSPCVVHVGRRAPLDMDLLAELEAEAGRGRPVAIVVDDAHRLDDSGALARIASGEHVGGLTLLVGARADGVRSAYGHWTREVAKSRCGLVMSARGDPDGDLLGVQIPRRPLVAPRAGLAWIVDRGPLRPVQVTVSG